MTRPINRRQFLHRSTVSATVASGVGAMTAVNVRPPTVVAAEPKTPIVDTHVHCFAGRKSEAFPYHAKGPYQPEAESSPEMLLDRMKQAAVDYAVIVHPEPYQDDHRYLEHCLKVGAGKLKGTCLFFADRDDTPKRMKELVERQGRKIVAARMHAYAPERLPPFDKPELKRWWRTAAELGLAVQLHLEPRYAPGFESLIKDFPKTTVIIDHLGRPFQGTEKEHDVVVGWSRFENTVIKIASLPDPRQYPHRNIAPIVKRLVKAFTPGRTIMGGGFDEHATGASYRAFREKVRGLIAEWNEADQSAVLGGTAAKLFAFGS